MVPVHCPGPEDSKKVSYVRLGWQTPHQDTQFPPKLHFEDFPDPPDGVKKIFFLLHGYLVKLKVHQILGFVVSIFWDPKECSKYPNPNKCSNYPNPN